MLILVGCAGLDDAMTPGMQIIGNDFDNSTIARQPTVVASRPFMTTDDAWHLLGFEWISSAPDTVYITAGVSEQILNIYDVAFMADDQGIRGIKLASNSTEYDTADGRSLGQKSTRRFSIPLSEFRKIASARIVKMKITRDNDFSLSRFGQDYPDVTASRKIAQFVVKIDELLAKK